MSRRDEAGKRAEAIALYHGGPFVPRDALPHMPVLRSDLRGAMPGTPEWSAARLALADSLMEQDDDEQWVARLPWALIDSRSSDANPLYTYHVSVPTRMPPEFNRAAHFLRGACNAGLVLGWHPNELKLLHTGGTALVFTSLVGRAQVYNADTLAMPGGFKGLAWLYWHLLGVEDRKAEYFASQRKLFKEGE